MLRDQEDIHDQWLWQVYRRVAEFINEPSDRNHARLHALLGQYRYWHAQGGEAAGRCGGRPARAAGAGDGGESTPGR